MAEGYGAGDAASTAQLAQDMADRAGVVYLRTTRGAYPVLYGPGESFPIGGAKVVRSSGADQVTNQVREMLKPGTSALFMVVEQMTTDKATAALSKYGGTVLKSSLSKEAEKQLQDALHGEQPS
jgi:Protein of unknown function (DUF1269)